MSHHFSIDNELFARVPGYSRIVAICHKFDSTIRQSEIDCVLENSIELSRSRYQNTAELARNPEIVAWRRAFSALGMNATKTRPALEALARRAVAGQSIRLGMPLVDIGTALSLTYGLPVGMHTLDDIGEPLRLTRADGDELFRLFDGRVQNPDAGEWIYKSGKNILTRRWVWKQGVFGSISETSKTLAINLDFIEGCGSIAVLGGLPDLLDRAGFKVTEIIRLKHTSPSRQSEKL